jgi:hypothetical protein
MMEIIHPPIRRNDGYITLTPITTMNNSSGSANTSSAGWNNGKTAIGDVVGALGVRIGEVIHHADEAFLFLDEDGNIEWLWRDDPAHLGWASARIVELEAKCAFFRADRPGGLFATKIAKVLADRAAPPDAQPQTPQAVGQTPAPAGFIKRQADRVAVGIRRFLEWAKNDELAAQQKYEMSTKRPDSMRHELSARRFIAQGLVIFR